MVWYASFWFFLHIYTSILVKQQKLILNHNLCHVNYGMITVMMMGFHMEICGTNIWMFFFSRFTPGIACTLPLLHMNYDGLHDFIYSTPVAYLFTPMKYGCFFWFSKNIKLLDRQIATVFRVDWPRWLYLLQGHCGYWTSMLGGGLMPILRVGIHRRDRNYTSLPHQKRNICWRQNWMQIKSTAFKNISDYNTGNHLTPSYVRNIVKTLDHWQLCHEVGTVGRQVTTEPSCRQ